MYSFIFISESFIHGSFIDYYWMIHLLCIHIGISLDYYWMIHLFILQLFFLVEGPNRKRRRRITRLTPTPSGADVEKGWPFYGKTRRVTGVVYVVSNQRDPRVIMKPLRVVMTYVVYVVYVVSNQSWMFDQKPLVMDKIRGNLKFGET